MDLFSRTVIIESETVAERWYQSATGKEDGSIY